MIEDSRVLREEFLPNQIQHRNSELNQISSALEPCLHDDQPENLFIFGPSGVGKTCIARFTLDRLREQLIDLRCQYVNCWQDYTRFPLIYRLLEGQGRTVDIHRQGTPKDVLLERLRDLTDDPFIVILDELDQLEDTDVLYDLYRIPNISLIMIANREEELFMDFDERIQSRFLSCPRIYFDTYSLDELIAILQDRVRWGFSEGAIDIDELEYIADAAAGDARVAIGILRTAARAATERGQTTITRSLVDEVIPKAKAEIKQKNIEKLNVHQSTLYEIISEEEPIAPGTLYEEYTERVEDARTDRTVRKYLGKMEHYNLITANGKGKAREYTLQRSPTATPH